MANGVTLTAFSRDVDVVAGTDLEYRGVGASMSLGGGATLAAGYIDGGADGADRDAWDLGVNFSF